MVTRPSRCTRDVSSGAADRCCALRRTVLAPCVSAYTRMAAVNRGVVTGRNLMARRRRQIRKSPAGRAREAATAVTLLAIALVLFAGWPLVLPGKPIQAL